MPQFQRRNTQPMTPKSYRRIARLLRGIADRLDLAAEGADRHQKQRLTTLLHGLVSQSRQWFARHRATIDGTLHVPTDRR